MLENPELLLNQLSPELLRDVYFRELASACDVKFGRISIKGPVLHVPVRLLAVPPDERNWPGSRACPAGEHIWIPHDTRSVTVHDVPIGAYRTRLRVARDRYRCSQSGCSAEEMTPLPDLLARSLPGEDIGKVRITPRLFEFVLEQWAAGLTQAELRGLTGLSKALITRIVDSAPAFLAALPPDDGVPLIVGIDEIYLHKRYFTVITDLSVPGETRLLELAWGRDGWDPERLRKAKELDKEPPEDAIRLHNVVRNLAERSLNEAKSQGHEWTFPIVTADGWTAFRNTLIGVIKRVAKENRVKTPELLFFPDVWHLKRGLVLEERKAKSLLDYGARNLEEKLFKEARHLARLEEIMYGGDRDGRAAKRARREFWPAEIAFNSYIDELGLPENCRWQADQESQTNMVARIVKHQSHLIDGLRQLHEVGLGLIEKVTAAGEEVMLAHEDQHVLRMNWRAAIIEFDKHPFTRVPDGGYAYGRLDRKWIHQQDSEDSITEALMLRTAASHWTVVLQREVAQKLTPGSPTAKEVAELVEQLDAKQWLVSADKDPDLYDRILTINEVTSVLLGNAADGNADSDKLANDVFLLKRPTNSRTERLNREIRAVLHKSENLTAKAYTRLRTRLLLRFSGRFLPSSGKDDALPIVTMPPECSYCGSDDVKVSEKHYEQSYLGLPAGWKPVRYRIRSNRWSCRACGSKSPATTASSRLQQTSALQAYLKHVSEQPRLGSLSLTLWHARTGVPVSRLRRLLTGHVLEKDKPVEGPARILGLAITSNDKRRNTAGTYRNYESSEELAEAARNERPRILVVNLRHKLGYGQPEQLPVKRGKKFPPLVPARLMAHERMSIQALITLLAEAHAQAGAELKVILHRRMHRFAEKLEAASLGRWTLITDAHNALPAVTRAAWRAYNHWLYGTYTKVETDKRTHRNRNRISPERKLHEEDMRRILVSGLLKDLTSEDAVKLKAAAKWHEGMVTDKDYYQEDMPLIREYLHAWRNLLLKFKSSEKTEFTASRLAEFTGGTERLLRTPPALKSEPLLQILEDFHEEMRLIVPMLQNSVPNSAADPVPNTNTGIYNSGQLGGVLDQLLQLDSGRGFQPT